MANLIDRGCVFNKITSVMSDCTAKHFKNSEDTAVALDMLRRCAQAIIDAPACGLPKVLHCGECKQWGRIESTWDTEDVKQCAVGGYMTGKDGYCHFGRR